jgi:hypothetical protein
VVRLRIWIVLHFVLFLGIGILGVGARRGIALPAGGAFSGVEQSLICSAAAAIMMAIMGIAATHRRYSKAYRSLTLIAQLIIAGVILVLPLRPNIPATAVLFILFVSFLGQTTVLVLGRKMRHNLSEI